MVCLTAVFVVLLLQMIAPLTETKAALTQKVVIIHMHGVTESWIQHNNFKRYVESKTGIPVHLLDAYNFLASVAPLAHQVKHILPRVQKIAAEYDAVIAVGYSQGGVIWRAMIEEWDGHNVDMLISLAAPQHGVYGSPPLSEYFIPFIHWYSRTSIYKVIYSFIGQSFGLFNYYVDPTHYNMYLSSCPFFSKLNNEVGRPEEKARRKANFLRLRKLVLIGGPGDDVVDPWQSTQFGFYTNHGFDSDPTTMEETQLYQEDLFGLKTLDMRAGVVQCTVPGLTHLQFRDNREMLDTCVIQNLQEYIKV